MIVELQRAKKMADKNCCSRLYIGCQSSDILKWHSIFLCRDLSNCSFSGWIPSRLGNLVNVKLMYVMTQTQWKILPFSVLEQYCFVCVAAGRHAYSAYNSKFCVGCVSWLLSWIRLFWLIWKKSLNIWYVGGWNFCFRYLAHNQLSGEIPYTVGQLDKLLQLSLANNQLSGNIPVSVPGGNYTVGLNNLTSLLIL
jgi:hypothetical protein